MKLYSFTGACALAPHIALEWAGADYSLELVKRSETREPDFLALNPVGKVPVLVLDDGRTLTQVNAVLLWIAETWPAAELGPEDTTDGRYRMQNWLSHFNGDIHPAFTPYFLPFRFADDKAAQKEVRTTALKELTFQLSHVERHMAGRDWVLERRSVLDPYLYVFCQWANFLPGKLDAFPNMAAFFKRMNGDAGVQAATKAQDLTG